MKNFYQYVTQFIIGGTLFVFLNYYSKRKDTVATSIIPALPVVFMAGYFYLYYYNGDVKKYTKNTVYTYGVDLFFMIVLSFLLDNYINDIFVSLFLALLLYAILIYIGVQYKILL